MPEGNTEFESLHVKLSQRPTLTDDNKVEIATDWARLVIRSNDVTVTLRLLDVEDDGALTIAPGDDVRYNKPDGSHVDFSVDHYGVSMALLMALAEAHKMNLVDRNP
jgi:hypothetical protein